MSDGLFNKYIVTKTDGSRVDPEAEYFVLRLDMNDTQGNHNIIQHRKSCLFAIRMYAISIRDTNSELANDLLIKYSLPEIDQNENNY